MILPLAAEPTDGRVEADVAIVGAGVAGLVAALTLPEELRVVVVDKGEPQAASTPLAQGGLAAAVGPDDGPERHAADTIAAGDGLCDPAAVRVLTTEAPDRLEDLMRWGVRFDRDPDGRLHLAREGGHRVARAAHRADATGAELIAALRRAAAPRVRRLGALAIALRRGSDGRVCGVWALHHGELVSVVAGAVLLATGGCGGLFAATTNRDGATGDGLALAWTAGAALRDLEFVQFHPTGLAVGAHQRLLLTEALRGAGATLHDRDGRRFMVDLHPDAELAPRHVVTRAILEAAPDGVWLDATGLGAERLAREFPTAYAGAQRFGFDLARQRVPVTPAAHYLVGGVRTDLWGRTSLPGLYAAGEVASTGAHGANRLAGNSLTEAVVFGHRAARAIAAELTDPAADDPPPPLGPRPPVDLEELRRRLRESMWRGCGPVRDADGLRAAADGLEALRAELGAPSSDPAHAELVLATTTGRLLVAAAWLRTESRGGHLRRDHPDRDPRWDGVHLEHIRAG